MKPTPKTTKRPSWVVLLNEKLNRLSFPSLTQGADKFTEGKQLAGKLSVLRHNKAELNSPIGKDGRLTGKGCTCIMAEVGRRLERAVLERDTKFLNDFRKASNRQDPLRDVYSWMLRNFARVESCRTKGAILALVKSQFPKRVIDGRNFYALLETIGLPLCKPSQIRTPSPMD